jgi:AcrR family transcriptional regulator
MTQLSVTMPAAGQPNVSGEPDRRAAVRPRDVDARSIRAAAWAVLRRSRFRSLKIRQVLAASNTSASNFYRLFPSRSHLLLALLADEIELVDRVFRETLDPAQSAAEQLHAWLAFTIDNVYDQTRAERTRMFLDKDLLEELPDQVRALYRVLGNRLAEIIRRGMRDGEFRAGNPEADSMMVQHLVRGILADGLTSPLPDDEDRLVSTVADFVLRALRVD